MVSLTEWAQGGVREIVEVDVEVDTSTIVIGDSSDLALDGFALLQNGLEGGHLGVLLRDWGILTVIREGRH